MTINKYEAVHKSPNGPGDARPTALNIIHDEALEGKLVGKIILITGCSSGIGIETARVLHTTGATLYLTARSLSKAKSALGDLTTSPQVHLLELDLNSLESVRACATEFLSKEKKLDVFIANAGIMATREGKTQDGFETQLGVNHLAHFLFFNLLKPALLAAAPSRAVFLSSIGHRSAEVNFDDINFSKEGSYNPWVAYGQSKTCNLWTANEIERRYGNKGLHSWSVQPGGVPASGLLQHTPAETQAALSEDEVLKKVFKNIEQGAATSVWGAVAKALEGKGGKYLEDCQIAKPWKEEDGQWAPGYASFAYDKEKEKKLWAMSLELVGMKEDA